MIFVALKRKEKLRSSKLLLTSISEKGPLRKKSLYTRKKKKAGIEVQEGCGQLSQHTSPDEFEGEKNAKEYVRS